MNQISLPPAIFIMGPTASGKTNAAVHLAQQLPVELISVDSALVYQGMDIGTAKPDAETLKIAPHHLIDIMPPTSAYSAAAFKADALALMRDIEQRGNIPVLVGGTMLYFNALENGLSGLPEANADVRHQIETEAAVAGWPSMHAKLTQIDPQTAARLAPNDMQRIGRALEVFQLTGKTMTTLFAAQKREKLPYALLKIALLPSNRKVLHERIAMRFDQMLAQGLVEEVLALLAQYPDLKADSTAMRCVGYRQVLLHLDGVYDEKELRDRGIFATRQLAKRQLTWVRGMEDVGVIDCLQSNINQLVQQKVTSFIARRNG